MARILFIDDDPFTLDTLTRAVRIFGHEALTAATGQDALSVLAEQTPDLIFVDSRLPDMDGLSLIKLFMARADTCDIPILMLSAGPEIDGAEAAKAAGARAYISKPIRLQALVDLIRVYTEP